MKNFVIFDLDGCVSDDRWRRGQLPLDPNDPFAAACYERYHSKCDNDKPMNLDVFRRMTNGAEPIFITGRPFITAFEKTHDWIARNLCGAKPFRLFCRASRETSPAFKSRVAKALINAGQHIIAAFDDRIDVLEAYSAAGIQNCYQLNEYGMLGTKQPESKPRTAADCLKEGEALYRERNGTYKDSPQRFGRAMAALYPDGLTLKGEDDFTKFGIFLQVMSKTTRFAASDNTHLDSIRDLKVYAAMLEAEMGEQ